MYWRTWGEHCSRKGPETWTQVCMRTCGYDVCVCVVWGFDCNVTNYDVKHEHLRCLTQILPTICPNELLLPNKSRVLFELIVGGIAVESPYYVYYVCVYIYIYIVIYTYIYV